MTTTSILGRVLAHGVATGDSGQLGALGTNVSDGAVLTQQSSDVQSVQWLSATSGSPSPTAGLVATFDLDARALVEISAAGISNGIPNQQTTSVRMWLWPGAQLTTEPGLVLEMAGLNVIILEPTPAKPVTGDTIDDGLAGDAVALTLEGAGSDPIASLFVGAVPGPPAAGEYQLIVTAFQPATSNAGGSALLLSLGAP